MMCSRVIYSTVQDESLKQLSAKRQRKIRDLLMYNKILVFSCNQQLHRSVHKNSLLFGSNTVYTLRVWNLTQRSNVCVWRCVFVFMPIPKGGVAVGVAFCKKVHNFQMDSETCTRFSGKVGHEPKDSWLTVLGQLSKRGRDSGCGL